MPRKGSTTGQLFSDSGYLEIEGKKLLIYVGAERSSLDRSVRAGTIFANVSCYNARHSVATRWVMYGLIYKGSNHSSIRLGQGANSLIPV